MTVSQLVPVVPGTIGNVQCLTVDGRTLHDILGVRRDFSTWIKGRISKYGFIQGQDFEVFAKTGENSELDSPVLGNQKNHGGDRRSQEYRLTLDMSKELCMVENNEKGRIARRYFIECERRLLSERPAPAPESEEERKRRLARERLRRHRERKREQLALLPAPKPYREQCAEVVAEMHALHGEFFKVSEKMMNTFAKPFYATALSPIPEHMKPFAHAMNLAINNFWMAMFKDFATLEDLYRAYVEAEKALNG